MDSQDLADLVAGFLNKETLKSLIKELEIAADDTDDDRAKEAAQLLRTGYENWVGSSID